MTRVERFEDLIAWQKARALTHAVYVMTRASKFEHDWALASQLQRAAVSIMANLAEGFDRGGSKEFHRFVTVSRASCAELKSHLYVALDIEYITQKQFDELCHAVDEVTRILGGLRKSLERPIRR